MSTGLLFGNISIQKYFVLKNDQRKPSIAMASVVSNNQNVKGALAPHSGFTLDILIGSKLFAAVAIDGILRLVANNGLRVERDWP